MNFFGHAAVASWRAPEQGFVLGAMLPDFASMIRARQPRVSRDDLDLGIAFHHRTDRVFHASPTFASLERAARRELERQGVRRGSALAVAHIGVEIILDAVLAQEDGATLAFSRALAAAGREALGAHVHWDDPSADVRYDDLVTALTERAPRSRGISPDVITWRLERALSDRPRLALHPEDVPRVRSWVAESNAEIEARAPALVMEVRAGLDL